MPTLFEKIIAREIPANIVFEDQRYIVITDINPQAPLHLLVITKRVIESIGQMSETDAELVGGMFVLAGKLVREAGYTDFRTVFNSGPGAQQTVFHLHLHVLAGRGFSWSPG